MEFSDLFPWIDRMIGHISNEIQEGVVVKAMIASLQPHQSIDMHIDGTHSLMYSQRCHWVISSDLSVEMIVEGKAMHWAEGQLYELNNLMLHGVRNPSDRPRLHMIVDIIPQSYVSNTVQYRDLTWDKYELIADHFTARHMITYDK
jgi:aspartyl/asparaginyl beta-hydroxylase (cupin superfamily)